MTRWWQLGTGGWWSFAGKATADGTTLSVGAWLILIRSGDANWAQLRGAISRIVIIRGIAAARTWNYVQLNTKIQIVGFNGVCPAERLPSDHSHGNEARGCARRHSRDGGRTWRDVRFNRWEKTDSKAVCRTGRLASPADELSPDNGGGTSLGPLISATWRVRSKACSPAKPFRVRTVRNIICCRQIFLGEIRLWKKTLLKSTAFPTIFSFNNINAIFNF